MVEMAFVWESARLQTFATWPKEHIMPARHLAAAGFVFVGNCDNVRCAFCGGFLHDWEPTDIPIEIHRTFFPNCPFIQYWEGRVPHLDCRHSPYGPAPDRWTDGPATAETAERSICEPEIMPEDTNRTEEDGDEQEVVKDDNGPEEETKAESTENKQHLTVTKTSNIPTGSQLNKNAPKLITGETN